MRRCALQCSFCATGSIGLKRQLTVDEIVDQVLFFAQRQTVDSVSFMGRRGGIGAGKAMPSAMKLRS